MFNNMIARIASGTINQVNDTVAGGGGGNIGPQVGYAPGQLGAGFWLDDSQIIASTAGSLKQVYGGHFRYVLLAAAASAVVVGQIVFWDQTVVDSGFQVTTLESQTVDGAVARAGIVLNNGWTPGNYSIIQDVGPVFVKFRAVLTDPGAIGCPCYCAGAGAGADNGFADVILSPGGATQFDVSLMQRRWLGMAFPAAPANGSLTVVDLDFRNIRG